MPWNPEQYNKFQSQRSAPFDDLLGFVRKRPGMKAVDLGCGTGELTLRLFEALPGCELVGIDNSAQMLEKAANFAKAGLSFKLQDQSSLTGEWDLVFSNAALQWTEDHPRLIPAIFSHLAPGGQLLVQIPSNHTHISHRLIMETAQEEPYKTVLRGFVRRAPVLTIEEYAQLFFSMGAEEILVFEKIYPHILQDSDAVIEWVSGTALVPYFERLGEHKTQFLSTLAEKFKKAMPEAPLFYPFKRILFSASKPG